MRRHLCLERLERHPLREIAGRRRPAQGVHLVQRHRRGARRKAVRRVSFGDKKSDDYRKGSTLYANDVVSVEPDSGKISVVAPGCGSHGSRFSSRVTTAR